MKKRLLYVAILLCLVVTACSDDEGAKTLPVAQMPELSEAESRAAKSVSGFDIDFFQATNDIAIKNENMVVSPLSASMFVSVLANIADESTKEQIVDALGCDDIGTLNRLSSKYMDWFVNPDPKVTVRLLNAFWYDKKYTLSPGFQTISSDYFKIQNMGRDFSNSSNVVAEINAWVKSETNNMIPTALNSEEMLEDYCLVNCLYFKGIWKEKFDKAATGRAVFHGPSSNSTVDMMSNTLDCGYVEGEDFQAVDLAFGEERFTMRFILPAEDVDIDEFISSDAMKAAAEAMPVECRVGITLPRFKILPDKNHNVTEILKTIGVNMPAAGDVFDFFTVKCFKTYVIAQKATVIVDEEGAEAAAVTIETDIMAPGDYVEVNFNRPFVFLINENCTGRSLFAGKVVNPKY